MNLSKRIVLACGVPFAVAVLPGAGCAQPYPYDNGYGRPRAEQFRPDDEYRRDGYRGDDYGRRVPREEERDRGRREDPRGGERLAQQQIRDAQTRHNQGVVALQQQFNQRQITRPQLEAGYRQLEAQMNGEVQRAQQGLGR